MWLPGRDSLLLLAAVVAVTQARETPDRPNLRIVGGEVADIKSVPYQVSVELNSAHHCGGSVLSAAWVLTAAHCVYGAQLRALQVRAGTDKLQLGGSVHAARAAVPHPKYVSGLWDWDVAVLQVATPLSFGAAVKAVRLPAAGREPQTNSPVVASGWGLTAAQKGSSGKRGVRAGMLGALLPPSGDLEAVVGAPAAPALPTQLRKVTVRVIGRSACTGIYTKALLTDRMLCAAAPGKDTCTYDSGGPLVDSAGTQVGVVSWGKGCADPIYPGVYVHVGNADVRAFIKSHEKSV